MTFNVENSILIVDKEILKEGDLEMFIEVLETKFARNEPIFANEILNVFNNFSRAYVFRLIDQAISKGELVKFDKGVYYMPIQSVLGTSIISTEEVVNKKYIKDKNEIFGIYSGLSLQNAFHLTTQMPNTIEVITNNESMRCRKIQMDGRTIILRKSRCKIDNKNVGAYTILQLLSEMKKEMYEEIKLAIQKYMIENQVSCVELISLSKNFPAQTTQKLLLSGVLNDFTSR